MSNYANGQPKPSRRRLLAGAGALAGAAVFPAAITHAAASGQPIGIGVISELSSIDGGAVPKGAQMAVDAINAKGGVLGRPLQLVVFDDHFSSTDAVRAFQRLVSQNKVVAVIASYVSEVVLSLEPWAARLKTVLFTPGAAADEISEEVHKAYNRNKYTFHGWLNSFYWAKSAADSAHDLLVEQLHMKSCVIMSEDAAWTSSLDATYLKFLPTAGLKVLDHIRFSPNTTDFTPIFNKIEAKKPDVIMTGLGHVGVVPIVQWTQGRVPIATYGINVQASSSTFWKDTHGAAEGAVTISAAGPTSAVTPKTVPFTNAYTERYGITPAYTGYSSYDIVFIIADAIARKKSTSAEELVTGIEATDYVGTTGRIKYYGRENRFAHEVEYGPDAVQGVYIQWQQGKLKTIWPERVADAKISYPSFVKLPI